MKNFKIVLILFFCIPYQIAVSQVDTRAHLRGYFPFNGNADDETGNGSIATVHGATLTDDRNGNPNSAYYFDGKDAYIEIENKKGGPLNIDAHFSVFAWVKSSSQAGPILEYSREKDGLGMWQRTNRAYEELFIQAAGYNPFCKRNFVEDLSADVIRDEKWCLVGFSYYYCSGILKIYCNGKVVKTLDTHSSMILNTTDNIRIGGSAFSDSHFKGSIDDIRFYSYAVSDEVADALWKGIEIPIVSLLNDDIGSMESNIFQFSAEIESYKPITSLKLFQNGELILSEKTIKLKNGRAVFNKPVKLVDGENKIYLEASSEDGVGQSSKTGMSFSPIFADFIETDINAVRIWDTTELTKPSVKLKINKLIELAEGSKNLPDSVRGHSSRHSGRQSWYCFKVKTYTTLKKYIVEITPKSKKYQLLTYIFNDRKEEDQKNRFVGRQRVKHTKPTSEPIASNAVFHLIAASYSDLMIAKKSVALYQQKGFPKTKVISENDKHRISIASFASEEKARLEAQKVAFSVWVMRVGL